MNLDFDRDVYRRYNDWLRIAPNDILFVKGSRQVGKTYSIKKFCEKNFKNVYYFNLTNGYGLDLLQAFSISNDAVKNIYKCIPTLIDDEDSVIVIDEIQEDPNVFNGVIGLNSKLKSKIIISGSYLGLLDKNKKFFKYIGEFFEVSVKPLSFSEFTKIFGFYDLFMSLDLFGNSKKDNYLIIKRLFSFYLLTGGMPKAIVRYLSGGYNEFICELDTIKTTLIRESLNYNPGVYNYDVIWTFFEYLKEFISSHQNGSNINISNELQKIFVKDNKLNMPKKDISVMYEWFLQSNVLKGVTKYSDCNTNKAIPNQKLFFNDIGFARYILNDAFGNSSNLIGYLCDNYIYNYLSGLDYVSLGFATFSGFQGELDFIIRIMNYNGKFGVEVKKGNDQGKSALRALKEKKIDKLVYFKGDTFGGIDGNKITVPIYLAERFRFEDFSLGGYESMEELDIFNKMIEDGKFMRGEE